MLEKKYRLRKNSEFVATYAQKQYVFNSYFTLNLGKQKPFENHITKVAFIVSKKVDKRAVIRNKIKRRMREAYKSLISENASYNQWISLIFSAKKECISTNYNIIQSQMREMLEKAIKKYV